MYKCKICNGEYNKFSKDNIEYYHVCPQLIDEKGHYIDIKNARDENIPEKADFTNRIQIDL